MVPSRHTGTSTPATTGSTNILTGVVVLLVGTVVLHDCSSNSGSTWKLF